MRPVRLVTVCLLAAVAATGCTDSSGGPAATPTAPSGSAATTGPGTATTATPE